MWFSIKLKVILLVMFLVIASSLIVGHYTANLKQNEFANPAITKADIQKEMYVVIAITLLFVLVIATIFALTMTEPFDKLIIGTQLVAGGQLDHRIEKRSSDEVGRLVDAFNDMIAKLRSTSEQRAKFSDIATLEKTKAEVIINSMADGVIVTDSENKIVMFNPAAEKMFELESRKAIGRHILHFKRYGFDNLFYDFQYRKNRPKVKQFEIDKPAKKNLQATMAPIKNERGKFTGTVSVIQDITKIKEIDSMKTEFVSTVSHELRTPLTSIKGYASLLVDGKLGELNEKQFKSASIINSEADRLANLINDILDLSKLESGKMELKMEYIDVEKCIDDSPALHLASKKGIVFSKSIPGGLPRIMADKNKITQVFTNLITNAVKFTNSGGSIVVRGFDKGGYLKFEISDTGVGIERKEIPKLFNKFYQVGSHLTRSQGGTGLGLQIVKNIVGLHGGLISVKSKSNLGTTMSFTLPKKPVVNFHVADGWSINEIVPAEAGLEKMDEVCWLSLNAQCKKSKSHPNFDKISICTRCDFYNDMFEEKKRAGRA